MIISCPACQTRFRLDETKIRGRGARVRCRRCGGPIIVMKPGAEPEREMPGGAPAAPLDLAAALRGEGAVPPTSPPGPGAEAPAGPEREARREAAERAGEETGVFLGGKAEPEKPVGTFAEPFRAEAGPARDEVDLAFEKLLAGTSEGEVSPPAEEGAGAEAPTPMTAGEEPVHVRAGEAAREEPAAGEEAAAAAGGDIEFAPDERIAIAPEAAAPPTEPPLETPPFDIARDFQEQLEVSAAAAAGELRPGEDFAGPPPSAPLPDWAPGEEEPYGKEAAPPFDITAAVRPQPEEGAERQAAPALREEGAEAPAVEKIRVDELQEEIRASAAAPAVPQPSQAYEPPPVGKIPTPPQREERAAAAPSAARPRVGLFVLLFIVLAAGGAWLGFTRDGQQILRSLAARSESWLPGKKKPQVLPVSNLIGYYESNAAAGKLFVIKGHVTNAGGAPRHAIRVVAALLDAKGQEMARKSVFAGAALSGDFLRQATREKIEAETAARAGQAPGILDIPPGKTVPFTVVFFDAPDGIEAYRLEAVKSE